MTPARTAPAGPQLSAALVPALARCGTRITRPDGSTIVCGLYLAHHAATGWIHLHDRCEACVLGLLDGERCEWDAEHREMPGCGAPAPMTCDGCAEPVSPEHQLDGHDGCTEPGRCCGCCEPEHDDDPDRHYEAARDAEFGL
jgi:hypothetical protein